MNVFTFLAPFYNIIFSSVQKRQGKELLNKLSPLKGKKVLDLGGGTGKFAAQMFSAGADVWLLDASPQMLKRASRILPSDRLILGDAKNLPFSNNTFDIITLVDVFHHIRNQEDTLSECYRILRPGGSLCLLEFSPECLTIRVLAGVERFFGEPSLFLSPEDLTGLLKKAGFIQIEIQYILVDEYVTQAKKPMLQSP
ncbi:MAG: methyltransferase domain-containing protein [Bacillota bacterium]|nr:methyltransferase domain-containing protein [Bacillota bacterium]